jgi:hypothetical protein
MPKEGFGWHTIADTLVAAFTPLAASPAGFALRGLAPVANDLMWRRQSMENCQAPPNKIDHKERPNPIFNSWTINSSFGMRQGVDETLLIAPKLVASVP